jgi:hypothetical protein
MPVLKDSLLREASKSSNLSMMTHGPVSRVPCRVDAQLVAESDSPKSVWLPSGSRSSWNLDGTGRASSNRRSLGQTGEKHDTTTPGTIEPYAVTTPLVRGESPTAVLRKR